MVSDTLCDRELASLSSLSRNNLFLISPCFGGKQLHSKLKPLLFYSQTLSLFQQQLSLKQHKIPLQPGSYYFSTTVLGHGLALWLHYTGHILRFLTQQQALFLGFIPDLLLGGPIAPPKPLQPFLFIFFAWRIFISITLSQSPGLLEVSTVQFIESAEQQNVVLESCSDPLCKSMGLE